MCNLCLKTTPIHGIIQKTVINFRNLEVTKSIIPDSSKRKSLFCFVTFYMLI